MDDELADKVDALATFIYERVREINTFNPVGMEDDSEQIKAQLQIFIEEWKTKAANLEKIVYGDRYIAMDAPNGARRIIKRFEDKNKDDAQRTLTSLRNVDKTVPASVLIWEGEYE